MSRSTLRRLLDAVAAALVAFYLVAAVPKAIQRAVNMLRTEAALIGGESLADGRARLFGDPYSRAIDEIRGVLPADRTYLLVDAGRPEDGGSYWVRYDLAPRPAVFAGRLDQLGDLRSQGKLLGTDLRDVVVAYGPRQPPRLYDLTALVGEVARPPGAVVPGHAP